VVTAAVYAPALGGGYLFDDRSIIVGSPLVEELKPLSDYFSRPFFTSSSGALPGYYRPLVVLSFAADYALHQGAASGLHFTNIALHLINAALFSWWLRARGSGPLSAIALAALWALHPRLTEAAAWISGRTDLMSTTFVLLALLAWRPTWQRRALSALLLLAGLLAKETALAGVAALCCAEWLEQRSRGERQPLVRALPCALPLLAALGAYLGLRAYTVGLAGHSLALGPALRGAAILEAVGRYAFDLFVPWTPDAVQGRLGRPTLSFVVPGALVLAACAGLLLRARKKLPAELAVPAALGLVALGLALHVLPIPSRMVGADRFLYLPLIGLLACAAPALERLWKKQPLARLATLLLVFSFGVVSFRRAALWADEVSFWVDQYTRANAVELYVPTTELAALFLRVGLNEEALQLSRRALSLGDDSASDATYNTALSLTRLERIGEARQLFEGLAKRARRPEAHARDLALLELQELRFDDAGRRLTSAFGVRPERREDRALLSQVARLQALHERLLADPVLARSSAGVRLRAELASGVGRRREAVALWGEIARAAASVDEARFAVSQLVQLSDLRAAAAALQQATTRFGRLPDLEGLYEVRRSEIEAALAAKPALQL
jgi:hypothetical protein